MDLSKNVSYREFVRSNTAIKKGIKNTPTEEHYANGVELAQKVIQPIRDYFGKPIRINSFYRSPELNAIIGGSKTSQHCRGEAVDLDATNGYTNAGIFIFIIENLEFDQLIWEFGNDEQPDWIHVSYKRKGENRGKIMRAVKENGKTVYLKLN